MLWSRVYPLVSSVIIYEVLCGNVNEATYTLIAPFV
ncbi:hypothetical protein PEDI_46040 [Persicobacter diffluens]|uniref:Uncharacterized protein n=1 Tax=Persicobacter diffluens TaxID=981 RepID=A0AAN4W4B8_9BACT|nr:hypothetical protein PEDI_46040 [Persicobacter diffluens]